MKAVAVVPPSPPDVQPRPSHAYELQNLITVCHVATLALRERTLLQHEGVNEGRALDALEGCLQRAADLAWRLDL